MMTSAEAVTFQVAMSHLLRHAEDEGWDSLSADERHHLMTWTAVNLTLVQEWRKEGVVAKSGESIWVSTGAVDWPEGRNA